MLDRVRARLSYANVVATLALFVALGGTSYAVGEITSRDVKNRSLKGGDLRRDTITGSEINEARLGAVPLARNADSAQSALTAAAATNAANADIARTAGSASTAAVADVAKDAQALAGQGAGSFEQNSTVQFGRAPVDPAGTSTETAVLSWPEMGVEVRSSTNQAACGGNSLRVGFRNTKASGPALAVLEQGNGSIGSVAAGATERFCGLSAPNAGGDSMEAQLSDSSGRVLFVQCFEGNGEIRCLGVRSEP